jgi:fluoride ion exporter CrcB/FEX
MYSKHETKWTHNLLQHYLQFSFLMGVITPPADNQRARLPWLHRDHPLQRDEVFHASLGTGFCGCLTTFASWNTQMVVMLDGTYCELGSQVVTVFFGYLIGFMGASYGFHLGRHCGLWMYNFRHRNEDEMLSQSESGGMNEIRITESQGSTTNDVALVDEGVELVDDDNVALQPVPSHLHKIPLFLTAVALLVAFVIGDIRNGIEFYKGMTLLWLLSPVGSLLRWRLSNLNRKNRGMVITISPDWIPWGTLIANLLATVLSACMEGLSNRYFSGDNPTFTNQWVNAMLFALRTGVAGSLSTVSTMVKESVLLSEDHPGHARGHYYSILTCISACLLGLAAYATTIRIN